LDYGRNWKNNPNYGAGNLTIQKSGGKCCQMSGKMGVVVAAVATTATT
jgi:hypothetical protein